MSASSGRSLLRPLIAVPNTFASATERNDEVCVRAVVHVLGEGKVVARRTAPVADEADRVDVDDQRRCARRLVRLWVDARERSRNPARPCDGDPGSYAGGSQDRWRAVRRRDGEKHFRTFRAIPVAASGDRRRFFHHQLTVLVRPLGCSATLRPKGAATGSLGRARQEGPLLEVSA